MPIVENLNLVLKLIIMKIFFSTCIDVVPCLELRDVAGSVDKK